MCQSKLKIKNLLLLGLQFDYIVIDVCRLIYNINWLYYILISLDLSKNDLWSILFACILSCPLSKIRRWQTNSNMWGTQNAGKVDQSWPTLYAVR